jgi:hypothetical protein
VIVRLTLLISAPHPSSGELHSAVAARLAEIGGRLTGWRPELNDAPARAYFKFENEHDCQRFIARARVVPGVSLEPPIEPAQ